MAIQLVVFTLDDKRYGLLLSGVERVVRAVEVTPFPKAPDIILGMINVGGRLVPVVNIRKRFGLLTREVELDNQFVIASAKTRSVALIVDAVNGVVDCEEQDLVAAESILPGLEHVKGVLKLADGMILLHDLDGFLSLEEERTLDAAIVKDSV